MTKSYSTKEARDFKKSFKQHFFFKKFPIKRQFKKATFFSQENRSYNLFPNSGKEKEEFYKELWYKASESSLEVFSPFEITNEHIKTFQKLSKKLFSKPLEIDESSPDVIPEILHSSLRHPSQRDITFLGKNFTSFSANKTISWSISSESQRIYRVQTGIQDEFFSSDLNFSTLCFFTAIFSKFQMSDLNPLVKDFAKNLKNHTLNSKAVKFVGNNNIKQSRIELLKILSFLNFAKEQKLISLPFQGDIFFVFQNISDSNLRQACSIYVSWLYKNFKGGELINKIFPLIKILRIFNRNLPLEISRCPKNFDSNFSWCEDMMDFQKLIIISAKFFSNPYFSPTTSDAFILSLFCPFLGLQVFDLKSSYFQLKRSDKSTILSFEFPTNSTTLKRKFLPIFQKNFSPEKVFLRLFKTQKEPWFCKSSGENFKNIEKIQIIQKYTSFVRKYFQKFSGEFSHVFLSFTKP